jgi:hypothetical protein
LDVTDSELETAMTSQWQYQIRFDLTDPSQAGALRRKHPDPSLEDYVAAAEAEGVDKYPLHAWTKATIENPAKKEKYLNSFTVYVEDQEVYSKQIADALEADLKPLATRGLITRLSKYDSNPVNNPQPPARSST